MKTQLEKLVQWLDLCKEELLKAVQYTAIFLAWYGQVKKNKKVFDHYFSIYLKVFHSRKLFRLLKALNYIPQIIKLIGQLKKEFEFAKIFMLLSKIFTGLFYALDNITIICMEMKFQYYKTIRRISYANLFAGILFSTIAIFIGLRQSFKEQADLKGELENLTPTQLLQRLAEIDNQRRIIAVKLIKAFGDLFPTLARTNLPQIILKTQINKGTVGFFGIIAAFTGLYLKTVVKE